MNAKVALREKLTIINMLSKHFTIGEGAENLIDVLTSTCSEKEKQEERANLVLFAFATIAKPLIDDVSVEPLQKEKDNEPFPPEEKIIVRSLKSKVHLIETVRKVCNISGVDAVEKVVKIANGRDAGYTFDPFFIGNTPGSIFTIEQWQEICITMSALDDTFDWESL